MQQRRPGSAANSTRRNTVQFASADSAVDSGRSSDCAVGMDSTASDARWAGGNSRFTAPSCTSVVKSASVHDGATGGLRGRGTVKPSKDMDRARAAAVDEGDSGDVALEGDAMPAPTG